MNDIEESFHEIALNIQAGIDHLRFTRGLWCALAIVGWVCFAIAVLA